MSLSPVCSPDFGDGIAHRIGRLRDLGFFGVVFAYFFFWVRPEWIAQYQEPVFFFDAEFFRDTVSLPGGALAYVAALLTQLFSYPWIGTIILLGLVFLTIVLFRSVCETLTGERIRSVSTLVPALLLTALHGQYAHSLKTSLGFLVAMAGMSVCLRFAARPLGFRFALFTGLGVLIFFLGSGAVLPYALFCGMTELLFGRRSWGVRIGLLGAYLLVGFGIPVLAISTFYLAPFRDVCGDIVPFDLTMRRGLLLALLWASVPLILLWIRFFRAVSPRIFAPEGRRDRVCLFSLIETGLLLLCMGLLFYFARNPVGRTLVKIDYAARKGRWHEVLETVIRHPVKHELAAFQAGRALFHTGFLLDRMFALPIWEGPDDLFLSDEMAQKARIQRSDLYFDMGLVNASLRWAHEAMSMRGETPWTLRRIAQIALLNGWHPYAEIALNRLEKSLFCRWARDYRPILEGKRPLSSDPVLASVLDRMPRRDFILSATNPIADLHEILAENPKNRMACEYLLAYDLLARRLGDLMAHLPYWMAMGEAPLPRHVEEAIVLYRMRKGPSVRDEDRVRPETLQRFRDYLRILQKHGNDPRKAKPELRRIHGDTYWYYVMFAKGTGSEKDSFPGATR